MKIGILSDTHDQLARTQLAVQLMRDAGVDALFHCGDLTGPAIVATLAGMPSWFVFGNNDLKTIPDLQKAADDFGVTCLGWSGVVDLAGRRIGVAHGHLTTDVRLMIASQPDFLLSGHSHSPDDSLVNSVRRINPGALHRAKQFTVATLELDSGQLEFLPVPR